MTNNKDLFDEIFDEYLFDDNDNDIEKSENNKDFIDNEVVDTNFNEEENIEDIDSYNEIFDKYDYEKDKIEIREKIKDFVLSPKILLPTILLIIFFIFITKPLENINFNLFDKTEKESEYEVVIPNVEKIEKTDDELLREYISDLENIYNNENKITKESR